MIDSYEFGKIVIAGKIYRHDVIILPSRIMDNWRRRQGHELCLADIESIIEELPRTFIIGTGESGIMKVLEEVKKMLESKGIEIIIMETGKACEEYNRIYKIKKTAAALHLTC